MKKMTSNCFCKSRLIFINVEFLTLYILHHDCAAVAVKCKKKNKKAKIKQFFIMKDYECLLNHNNKEAIDQYTYIKHEKKQQ